MLPLGDADPGTCWLLLLPTSAIASNNYLQEHLLQAQTIANNIYLQAITINN